MSNVVDYIKWRGDLSFKQSAFNEVDNLILSTIAYMNFDKILTPDKYTEHFKLSEVIGELLSMYGEGEKINEMVTSDPVADREFLEAVRDSYRFGHTRISRYVNKVDEQRGEQFSAATFFTRDGAAYVAFRGTDDSLVGWKENFNISFMSSIPAQKAAVKYYEEVATAYPEMFRIGGHSKGGNLAVYAAAFCRPDLQEYITEVYSNDGPGFNKKVICKEGYTKILDRVRTLVPQSSVVGMLLEHEEPYTVIKSDQVGILQHNPYSWQVLGAEFITLSSVDENSKKLDRALHQWVEGMDDRQLKQFVDTLFTLIGGANTKDLEEFNAEWLKNTKKLLRTMNHLDEADKKMMTKTLSALFKIAGNNLLPIKK